jgi:methyl-accepting chemotaxis protein
MRQKYTSADTVIEISLGILSFASLLIAPIYSTLSFAIPVVVLLLAAYFGSKIFLTESCIYQYVGSVCLGLYTALLIYQMHGMIEMHFLAFIGSILLINYRKWTLQIPITLVIVVHHAVLSYIQYIGYKEVFFTSDDYMDLETFLVHVGLAAVIFFLSGLWAYRFKKNEEMIESKNKLLEAQMDNINRNIVIANQITRGNLDNHIASQENDELGLALSLMQQNLLIAKKREDEEKYFNLGLAQSGEILGKMNQNLDELCVQILKFVVKYMAANQGEVFLRNDDDKDNVFLEVSACYAHDRKKFLQKIVYPHEGLVGTAYVEKEIIYLTEVPEDYVHISSGLGHANPTSVLIVPLIFNDTVYGIIELAFFKALENYQIQFMKKVGENTASVIATVKTNEHTKYLLALSQQKSDELMTQKDEMRQALHEMKTFQETIFSKQEELKLAEQRNKQILENSPMGIILMSKCGEVVYTNYVANILLNIDAGTQIPNYSEIFKVLKIEKLIEGSTKRTKIFPLNGLNPLMVELVISKLDNNFLLFFKDVTEAIKKENDLIIALEQAEKLKKVTF